MLLVERLAQRPSCFHQVGERRRVFGAQFGRYRDQAHVASEPDDLLLEPLGVGLSPDSCPSPIVAKDRLVSGHSERRYRRSGGPSVTRLGQSRRGLPVGRHLVRRRAPGSGDGFEAGVDTERPKETADVVPDRLGTQMKLGRDLLRRVAPFQQTKHLDLTRGEMRVRRSRRVVGAILDQPEHTDHPLTVHERHRADLHGHARTGGRNQNGSRICGRRST